MKIFFAGSMHGGRGDVDIYKALIERLKKKYDLLSDHVGFAYYEDGLDDKGIFEKDTRLIGQADVLIAEVSVPSSGTGYEIAFAVEKGKKVVCLYRNGSGALLSPMIGGNPNVTIVRYSTSEEALSGIDNALGRS